MIRRTLKRKGRLMKKTMGRKGKTTKVNKKTTKVNKKTRHRRRVNHKKRTQKVGGLPKEIKKYLDIIGRIVMLNNLDGNQQKLEQIEGYIEELTPIAYRSETSFSIASDLTDTFFEKGKEMIEKGKEMIEKVKEMSTTSKNPNEMIKKGMEMIEEGNEMFEKGKEMIEKGNEMSTTSENPNEKKSTTFETYKEIRKVKNQIKNNNFINSLKSFYAQKDEKELNQIKTDRLSAVYVIKQFITLIRSNTGYILKKKAEREKSLEEQDIELLEN